MRWCQLQCFDSYLGILLYLLWANILQDMFRVPKGTESWDLVKFREPANELFWACFINECLSNRCLFVYEIWPETCSHNDLLMRLQRKVNYCPFKYFWRLLWSTKPKQTKPNSKSCPWAKWIKLFPIILFFRGLQIVYVM